MEKVTTFTRKPHKLKSYLFFSLHSIRINTVIILWTAAPQLNSSLASVNQSQDHNKMPNYAQFTVSVYRWGGGGVLVWPQLMLIARRQNRLTAAQCSAYH